MIEIDERAEPEGAVTPAAPAGPPRDDGPLFPEFGASAPRTGGGGGAGGAGPADSFEVLFRREYAGMVQLHADDPENIAQEAFSRLHDRWSRLGDPAAAGGYLRTTVVNLVRSRHRHLAVARRWLRHTDDQVVDTEAVAVRRAEHSRIIAALQQLSSRHREALVLRYWLDMSEKDMAKTMGVAQGTVKSHLSRALSALRTLLDTEGPR